MRSEVGTWERGAPCLIEAPCILKTTEIDFVIGFAIHSRTCDRPEGLITLGQGTIDCDTSDQHVHTSQEGVWLRVRSFSIVMCHKDNRNRLCDWIRLPRLQCVSTCSLSARLLRRGDFKLTLQQRGGYSQQTDRLVKSAIVLHLCCPL